MLGLLPPELVQAVVKECSKRDRCRLRATCRTLKDHVDPVVFRYLSLGSPHAIENQIIALVTRSSRACDLTTDLHICWIPNRLPPSQLSWPYFGHCDDLRVHLPSAISALRNLTCFRWTIANWEPSWLVDALIRAVADLPQLSEATVEASNTFQTPVPLGLFSHLSKLTVACGGDGNCSYFVHQLATAITNSPNLKALKVTYWGLLSPGAALPSLSELFMGVSVDNPLSLEHLGIRFMDATVDSVTIPHLSKLTSFQFETDDEDIQLCRRFWTSLMVNGVQLSEVLLTGIITEEVMLYLSSTSGLKALDVDILVPPPGKTLEPFRRTFFAEVLPRHADTLQKLKIAGGSNDYWMFDNSSSTSIMRCRRLRDLLIAIDGEKDGITPQYVLDTVSQLPELKLLRIVVLNDSVRSHGLSDFRPVKGLRYVADVRFAWRRYVWEEVHGDGQYREVYL